MNRIARLLVTSCSALSVVGAIAATPAVALAQTYVPAPYAETVVVPPAPPPPRYPTYTVGQPGYAPGRYYDGREEERRERRERWEERHRMRARVYERAELSGAPHWMLDWMRCPGY